MRNLIIALTVLTFCSSAATAETAVKGELYPLWYMDFSENADNYNAFELNRSYVTVTSDLNEQTSARFTVDLRNTSGFSGYDIILKYGYLDWKPTFLKRTSFRFGLHQTMYIDYLNKIWGRRYLEKTASDLYKFLTSADLGVSSKTTFGNSKATTLHIGIYNGTSYTDVEDLNNSKDLNAVLITKPLQGNPEFKNTIILGQVYLGTQNEDFSGGLEAEDYRNTIFSIGGILDYNEQFSFGLDANWQTLGTGVGSPDLDKSAISLFGTYYIGKNARDDSFLKNINLFGRIDFVDPNGSTSDDGSTQTIIGVEHVTSSRIKTSVNLRMTSYEDSAISTDSYLFFNALVSI